MPPVAQGDTPANAPEHCPVCVAHCLLHLGTESQQAGKSDACQGCPNQEACATAPKGPDPAIALITSNLHAVKHKLLILSGKGGVGKSTFTSQLAFALAHEPDSESSSSDVMQIGVMDVDICGPSIPKIMGLEGEQVHPSGSGWQPVYLQDNLAVMSIGFMLENPDDVVIWRGPKKNGLIKQFLRDVEWGELDYLLVDTPPGTSDEHLSITTFLKNSGIDGAIVITTPQEVALQDVRKEIDFCRKVNIPVVGVVENMSGFVCPNCKGESIIFPATTGGAVKMADEMNVPFLGKIPLDPRLGRSCDEGVSFLDKYPDSPASQAYLEIIENYLRSRGPVHRLLPPASQERHIHYPRRLAVGVRLHPARVVAAASDHSSTNKRICQQVCHYLKCIFTLPNITRIPEAKILPLFDTSFTAPITSAQVLMLLYVTCYNEGVLATRSAELKLGGAANPREKRHQGAQSSSCFVTLSCMYHEAATLLPLHVQSHSPPPSLVQPLEYNASLIERIPVRRILTHAETYGGGAPYGAVYPDLLGLCASHCPELFDVTSFLVEEGRAEEDEWFASTGRRKRPRTEIEVQEEVLAEFLERPSEAVQALNRLAKEDPVEVAPHAHRIVSAILPRALDPATDPAVLESFVSVWELLNSVIPRELWTITANRLQNGEVVERTTQTYQELVNNPLLVFSDDSRLFRSPILFRLFLQMIECFRVAAKHKIWRRFYLLFAQRQNIFSNNNVSALILGQDTALLQCLLDHCVKREEDTARPEVLARIRSLACAYLHQLFLEDTVITKLLHFQTYPRELIPVVVEEVPSILLRAPYFGPTLFSVILSADVCFQFLQELIRQPQQEKQVFGIELACRLCDKYPMENYIYIFLFSSLPLFGLDPPLSLETVKNPLLRWLQKLAPATRAATAAAATAAAAALSATVPGLVIPPAPAPATSVPLPPVTEHVLDAIPLYAILVHAFPLLGEAVLVAFEDVRRELPSRSYFHLALENGPLNQDTRMRLGLLDVLEVTAEHIKVEIERDKGGLVNKSVM
ncbi:hypothetical protein BC937DRAFT_86312 [Endogone sp. FLAS-F59071]|nr:hypothetical protein BC937DRAFT_86312 [Endogone sp. FLAS-F59071]|eukprot:RUS20124.1 hypothetical protein BC937DRAFT_86312 [Endogone sp. FLAS-F59071]